MFLVFIMVGGVLGGSIGAFFGLLVWLALNILRVILVAIEQSTR